jgi:hypothetical protein
MLQYNGSRFRVKLFLEDLQRKFTLCAKPRAAKRCAWRSRSICHSPVARAGFKLQRDMCESAPVAAGIGWLAVDEIVRRFQEAGKRLMAIDGFMGSGKTPCGPRGSIRNFSNDL